jgi:hypothetical protein
VAGGEAAARAGEHAAQGIIAKAAKDVLRDAEGPAAAAAGRDAAGAAAHGGESLGQQALRRSRHYLSTEAGQLSREFPELSHGVNPRYTDGGIPFRNNCQSCVVATDRSLQGAASSAVARPFDAAGRPLADPRFAWPDGVNRALGGNNPLRWANGYEDIADELVRAGDGSRGIVHGLRVDATGKPVPGHVFNVVNRGGVLHFIDGQTGEYAYLEPYRWFQFIGTA